jgi:hypothetical protein
VGVPRLHEHVSRFVERNAFLHATLGVLSVGERFQAYCEELARDAQPEPATRARSAPSVVFVLLGALSLQRKLQSVLAAFAREGDGKTPRRSAHVAPDFPVPRRVLR